MKKQILLVAVSFIFHTNLIFSQGCCDAGACQLSPFKSGLGVFTTEFQNEISIGGFIGKGQSNVNVLGANLEVSRKFNAHWGASAKAIFNSYDGDLGKTSGLSDLFLALNFAQKENLTYVLGVKIPLSDGDTKLDGKSLPMPYQPSLGIFDAILGVSYKLNKFGFSVIGQIPLTKSDNTFIPYDNVTNGFIPTNKLSRKPDAVARVAYDLFSNERFFVAPSVLAIYHIANDDYTHIHVNGTHQEEVEGSKGLTVNFGLRSIYWVKPRHGIELNMGFPLATREKMPDGLTRKFVASLDYKFRF